MKIWIDWLLGAGCMLAFLVFLAVLVGPAPFLIVLSWLWAYPEYMVPVLGIALGLLASVMVKRQIREKHAEQQEDMEG